MNMVERRRPAQGRPGTVDPAAFADDSALPLSIPESKQVTTEFGRVLTRVKAVTGMAVNVAKSEILPMKNLTAMEEDILSELGKIRQEVKHLGVQLGTSRELASANTLQAGLAKMESASDKVGRLAGGADIILKKGAVTSVVSSIMTHRLWVYPPGTETINETWSMIRKAVWENMYQDKRSMRKRIALKNITRPVTQGGLGIAHPLNTAALSLISSVIAVATHTIRYPGSSLGMMFFSTKLVNLFMGFNSKTFTRILALLKPLFEGGGDEIIQRAIKVLQIAELDTGVLWSAPTILHSKESNQFELFYKTTWSEADQRRVDGGTFPTAASLCSQRDGQLFPEELNEEVEEADEVTRKRLKSIHRELKLAVGTKPVKKTTSMGLTWGQRLMENPKFLKTALKRSAKKALHPDDDYTPPAYLTRLRDGETVPSKDDFVRSYRWASDSRIPSILRSFHLEYLNRTLLSNTKLNNMKVHDPPPPNCHICRTPANTHHMVNGCVMPRMWRQNIRRFLSSRQICQDFGEEVFLDYGWFKQESQLDGRLQAQLAIIILMGKKAAFELYRHPNWASCTPQLVVAKMITAAKLTTTASKTTCEDDIMTADFLNFILEETNTTLGQVEDIFDQI